MLYLKKMPQSTRIIDFLKDLNSNWHLICLKVRACLHEGGGPQVGEVTCGGLPHLSCKSDHIKMRDYMDKRVTPSKRVISPI